MQRMFKEQLNRGRITCQASSQWAASRGSSYYSAAATPQGYNDAGCLRWLNDLTVHHNDPLRANLSELRRDHPDVSIVYVDYYDEVLDAISSPARYGFVERMVLDACCGGGGFHNANFTVHCTEPGAVQCPDPAKYVSWDGLHMTEAMYKFMAEKMPMVGIEQSCVRNSEQYVLLPWCISRWEMNKMPNKNIKLFV
jgi:hypothetical protein